MKRTLFKSHHIVTFRLNTRGAKRFGILTQRNVGQPFAINLDGKVMSAPVIRDRISARGQIEMGAGLPFGSQRY